MGLPRCLLAHGASGDGTFVASHQPFAQHSSAVNVKAKDLHGLVLFAVRLVP